MDSFRCSCMSLEYVAEQQGMGKIFIVRGIKGAAAAVRESGGRGVKNKHKKNLKSGRQENIKICLTSSMTLAFGFSPQSTFSSNLSFCILPNMIREI